MDILQETIDSHLPGPVHSSGKCISINCPCCVYMGESRDDTRHRGGVFFEMSTTGYNCFNCGFKFRQEHSKPLSFRAKKFLELIGTPKDKIQKVLFVYRKNDDVGRNLLGAALGNNTPKRTPLNLNFIESDLPPDCHLLSDIVETVDSNHNAFKAYSLAHERGIENYPYLMWSASKEKRMDEYLIIPFIYQNKVLGYQGRYFGDSAWHKTNARFRNHNPNSGEYLFGMENVFMNRKYLIINESLIDSILYHGVGSMSHSLSPKQIRIINEFKGEKILVPDHGKGGRDMVDIALDNDWSVYFPFWDTNHDLGSATQEYGKMFILSDIIQNKVTRPLTIKLKKTKL